MSNSVLLSSNIRSNLLALQSSADLLAVSQERLSTGKKVNSALDNATSFFTSQALSDKATNLNGLLDGISNGIQTIKAANQGATSVASLLKTAKAIAQQAKAATSSAGYSATSSTAQTTGTGTTLAQKAGTSLLTAAGNGIAAGDTLTFASVTNGVTSSKTFTVAAGSTVNDLVTAINGSGVASVKIEDNGTLTFASSGNLSVTSSDTTATSILGFTATAGVVSTTAGASSSAVDYTAQFADVLNNINNTVQDSGFNGINLLAGGLSNTLSIKFDDKSSSKLDVSSTDISTNGLSGLSGFSTLNSSNAQTYLDAIDSALSTVQNIAGTLGNKLTIVQNRQDFAKNLSNILQTGSDNLTAADTNFEAANVLALQTRQSLSQSALSLANQQNQGVLQLLR